MSDEEKTVSLVYYDNNGERHVIGSAKVSKDDEGVKISGILDDRAPEKFRRIMETTQYSLVSSIDEPADVALRPHGLILNPIKRYGSQDRYLHETRPEPLLKNKDDFEIEPSAFKVPRRLRISPDLIKLTEETEEPNDE